jgi:3-dehydro-L-gulonate 2-dehydrogenase
MSDTIRIPAEEMRQTFLSLLLKNRFEKDKAELCADIFIANSMDGVYSHGVNRFATFIRLVKDGFVIPGNEPSLVHVTKAVEQWDGALGAGMYNAAKCTDRAMQLAKNNGIGCVALANTNHWMRGGYYGWQAASKGFVFIAWTNTIANMPAWNAIDPKLGNNPLVIAVPYNNSAIVLDMAASQFSYGALEMVAKKKEQLPVYGGYNQNGELTKEPSEILESRRVLPIGYWKGAGLSLLLDILSAILSGGLSTHEITNRKTEHSISQVFIAIDLQQLKNYKGIETCIHQIINDYKTSVPEVGKEILYPGERVIRSREDNLKNGVPVLKTIWDEVLAV